MKKSRRKIWSHDICLNNASIPTTIKHISRPLSTLAVGDGKSETDKGAVNSIYFLTCYKTRVILITKHFLHDNLK